VPQQFVRPVSAPKWKPLRRLRYRSNRSAVKKSRR
jgi:hypothetical protein